MMYLVCISMYMVYTWYVLVHTILCINMRTEPCRFSWSPAGCKEEWVRWTEQQGYPGSDEDDFGDGVPEDDDMFNSGQDVEVMEDVIRMFMDSLEAQEH